MYRSTRGTFNSLVSGYMTVTVSKVSAQFQSYSRRTSSQDALIVTGTIRDNILFGNDFDEKRYQRVLDACALTSEVQKFRAGDQTMLGDKGGRLSGGQKQRVVRSVTRFSGYLTLKYFRSGTRPCGIC